MHGYLLLGTALVLPYPFPAAFSFSLVIELQASLHFGPGAFPIALVFLVCAMSSYPSCSLDAHLLLAVCVSFLHPWPVHSTLFVIPSGSQDLNLCMMLVLHCGGLHSLSAECHVHFYFALLD